VERAAGKPAALILVHRANEFDIERGHGNILN